MSKSNGRIHPEDEYTPRTIIRERSSFGPFMMGAIIGGAIGAALALLYAPAEGTELRRGLGDTLEDITEGAKGVVRGVKSTAEKIFTEGMASEDEEDSLIARTRERADDILEDADRAIAEARRRTTQSRARSAEDGD